MEELLVTLVSFFTFKSYRMTQLSILNPYSLGHNTETQSQMSQSWSLYAQACVYFMCCRWIATPLAFSVGIKQKINLKAEDNPILEAYYTTQYRKPSQVNTVSLKYNICASLGIINVKCSRTGLCLICCFA